MASIVKTGPKSWRCLVRRKGHKALCRTFRTEREARDWGEQAEAQIDGGGLPATSADTVAAAVQLFRELRESLGRPVARQSSEHYMLQHLADVEGIGAVPILKLTPQRLAQWCRERHEDGAGPCTVGMEISKLGTVLRFASISRKVVLPDVVAAAMPLLTYGNLVGASQSRDRRPTPDEMGRLLAALDPTMADLVRFACATAMRRGEITRILWSDVDESRHLVLIRDRKHPRKKVGNHQLVPLLDRTGFDAWAILQRQPRVDARVFPIGPETVSDRFLDACRICGIVDLHFHDLRHHATSLLFESGMTIEQVPLVTGHARWADLKRYTNLRPESLHASSRDRSPRPDSLQSDHRDPGMSGS